MNEASLPAYVSRLFTLYERLRATGWETLPDQFGCSAEQLLCFDEHYHVELPRELKEFLTLTLPVSYLDIGVYKTGPPAELLDEQLQAVPFYPNIENHLFGIGWWSGDGDGDGWVYDLIDRRVHAVAHGNAYDHTRESFLASESYLQFDGFGPWVDYLSERCIEHGWIS
ncbi:MAG: hypothetical protein AAFX06_14795 [Planctomycetota bacterium]